MPLSIGKEFKEQLPGFKWNKRTRQAFFDVRDSTGKRHRQLDDFESVEKARSAFAMFRDGLKKPAVPAAEVVTFGHYVETYWPMMRGKTKERTFKNDSISVRTHLIPFFKDDRLENITELRIEEYVGQMTEGGVSAPTLNYSLRMLRKVLHNARKRKRLSDVPSMPFAREATLRNEFTDEERTAYLSAFDDQAEFMAHLAQNRVYGEETTSDKYQTARRFGGSMKPDSDAAKLYFQRFHDAKDWFLVALHTGLRRGDVTNLRWSGVNFKEGFIRVTVEKTSREATVPMSTTLRRVLLNRKARPVVSEYVLVNGDGHRYPDTVIDRYHKIAKAIAGVTRRFRVHDLRHSFGSVMASAGASELMLKEFFGHGSTAMVKRYSRPSAAAMTLVAAALDGMGGPDGHPNGHRTALDVERLIDDQDSTDTEVSAGSGIYVGVELAVAVGLEPTTT
jgi:integrase